MKKRSEEGSIPPGGENEALRLIIEGTVSETGAEFFRALVRNLCRALGTEAAWVTEYLPEKKRLRSLAFWLGERYIEEYEYDIRGTPCESVIEKKCLAHFVEGLTSLFPEDPDLERFEAVSYLGIPLFHVDGKILGHLAVMDTKALPREERIIALFRVFAARAEAEYRRLKVEEQLRSRERLLSGLLEAAADAILVLDEGLAVVRANPAACRSFGDEEGSLSGRDARALFDGPSGSEFEARAREIAAASEGRRQHWFPKALEAVRTDGTTFPAEATLSSFESHGRLFYTVILRNVNDRIAADRKIRLLTDEAEYLREAARGAAAAGEILGKSPAVERLLESMARVAEVDTTVLILGETGTGKELVARSIHRGSRRRDAPLVRVNCAAIPGALMESEFFGHEKGAFTGAASAREGRFSLADGGTIFLDEVGELPFDLQSKLLRVLQEGEFEPLGSAGTRKVDVRIIAATNRDLKAMVREGKFREDLYYRLNVFPLSVPPLRERGDDVVLLARAFAAQLGQRMGRRLEPLRDDDMRRLKAYRWPGNVRELQNVIERAIILSPGPRLELDRSFPEADLVSPYPGLPPAARDDGDSILSAAEMESLERDNILRSLEAAGWKVAGDRGAASLLGLPPSTLTSRMKALGIRRPPNGS